MRSYVVLNKQAFTKGQYSIVPIRHEDRYLIMQWRNEQMYHLRQKNLLTIENQDLYFNNVVNSLFYKEKPDQILFSYLENDYCIGYGGLVHINWEDLNAEISFLMDTSREANEFEKHWINFLSLIESVAFTELKLHKIYTYAYDLRPQLYLIFDKMGLKKEAELFGHKIINQKFISIIIHSKFNISE